MKGKHTDPEGCLSQATFEQIMLFKSLVETAEKLLAEDQPHDRVLDVLGQRSKPIHKPLKLWRKFGGSFVGRVAQAEKVVHAAI